MTPDLLSVIEMQLKMLKLAINKHFREPTYGEANCGTQIGESTMIPSYFTMTLWFSSTKVLSFDKNFVPLYMHFVV